MRSVHVGIGHDNDVVIAELVRIVLILTYATA